MNFGKYAILDNVKHVFTKEPNWYWLINPATVGAELSVARLLSTDRTKIDADGTKSNVMATTLEIAMREIAVTFGGTNIPMSETDATPVLPSNATVAMVEVILGTMPREMVLEIWAAVGDACPGWGPTKKAGEAKNS